MIVNDLVVQKMRLIHHVQSFVQEIPSQLETVVY